jgi:hypothetical protein
MEQRKPSTYQHNAVTPTPGWRIKMDITNLPIPGINHMASDEHERCWLADIEIWISNSLSLWQSTNITRADACINLAKIIQAYTKTALCIYDGEPEALSMMILSAMELWVAMDKVATYHYPILLNYGPAIPVKLFSPLLLPRRGQMERILVVESYLNIRHYQSNSRYPSALHGLGSNCLAERFFDGSSLHMELRKKIETDAENERTKNMLA